MHERWSKIEQALIDNGVDPLKYLAAGASEETLANLEKVTGLQLPEDMKTFYRLHDGQQPSDHGLVFGIELLPIQGILESWRDMKNIQDSGLNEKHRNSMISKPDGHIRKLHVNTKWLPFTHDQGRNHIGLDFDPDVKGTMGQVIIFGRYDNERKVICSAFIEFVDIFIRQLETLTWSLTNKGWKVNGDKYRYTHYYDWY